MYIMPTKTKQVGSYSNTLIYVKEIVAVFLEPIVKMMLVVVHAVP